MKTIRKRRFGAAILALVLVVAIAASTTLAWHAITQRATNPFAGEAGAGGRVHDDFDSESGNKDVYAENYGAIPLWVRIRLSEFMIQDGVLIAPNTNFNYPMGNATYDAWPLHIPLAGQPTVNNNMAGGRRFRDYVEWEFGGQKWFMPTHNQDNRCLQTVASGDAIDFITGGQTALGGNNGLENFWGPGDTHTDTLRLRGGRQLTDVTHTAQETMPHVQDVITMSQWMNGVPALNIAPMQNGPFWVIDYDGWAYWAELLQPGEATSLLLDQVNILEDYLDPGFWQYAIFVEGEFATGRSWEGAWPGLTPEAEILLRGPTPIFTVTPATSTINAGQNQTLTASLTTQAGNPLSAAGTTWQIVGTVPNGVSLSATSGANVQVQTTTAMNSTIEVEYQNATITRNVANMAAATQAGDIFADDAGIQWRVLYVAPTGERKVITEHIHMAPRRLHSTNNIDALNQVYRTWPSQLESQTHLDTFFANTIGANVRNAAVPVNMPRDVRLNTGTQNSSGVSQEGQPRWVNTTANETIPITVRATNDGQTAYATVNVRITLTTSTLTPTALGGNGRNRPGSGTVNAANPAIFNLSMTEINTYFARGRSLSTTGAGGAGANARRATDASGNLRGWWSRSPGGNSNALAAIISYYGRGQTTMATNTGSGNNVRGFRPAMWIQAP